MSLRKEWMVRKGLWFSFGGITSRTVCAKFLRIQTESFDCINVAKSSDLSISHIDVFNLVDEICIM